MRAVINPRMFFPPEQPLPLHPDPPSPDLSRERFAAAAQAYVTSPTHARGADLERLFEMATPQPDWSALDVATGGGHTALQLAPFVRQVTACDLTPAMLEAARHHLQVNGASSVTFCLAEAGSLPFAAASFDLVTCRIAAHHFPDVPGFLRAAARTLRTGGVLILQDHVLPEGPESARFIDDFERLRDPSHSRAYCQKDWEALVLGAGLGVEHAEIHHKRHNLQEWAARQGCTPETLAHLEGWLADAPPEAAEWLAPQDMGTPRASFANRHLLLRAVKLGRPGGGQIQPPGGTLHLAGGRNSRPVLRRMV